VQNQQKPKIKKKPSFNAKYITSAVTMDQYPPADGPEVAIVGRSNAGKSSLINAMAQSQVAKVSSTAGKTTLLNFFQFGPKYRLVDMPGYGFASRSRFQVRDWERMIETYISSRGVLAGLVLVMDVRRNWAKEEQMLIDWLRPLAIPCIVVLTKSDKLGKNERNQAVKKIKTASQSDYVYLVSCLSREGVDEFENVIFETLVKPQI
jgi:GTP-binding protein